MPSPVICVLDTETTGLDPANGAVVEFAACVVQMTDGAWAPSEVFSRFVHPGMPIPPESSAIHHIVDADVADAAPLAHVLDAFGLWLASRGMTPALFAAHNAPFDRGFLGPLAQKYPEVSWLCTQRLAHHLLPGLPSYSNQALRYRLQLAPQFAWPLHVADAPTLIAPRATRLSRRASCATSSGWRGPAFPRSADCGNWPNMRRPPTSSSAYRLASTRERPSRTFPRTISTGSGARRRTRTSFLPLRTGVNRMPRLVRKPFKPLGKTRRFPIPPNRRHQDRRRREERRPPRDLVDCE